MGCRESSSKRDIYVIIGLSQDQEKSQVNNLTLHLKELENEEKKQSKVSRRKEIIKIRTKLNKIQKQRLYKNKYNQELVLCKDQ